MRLLRRRKQDFLKLPEKEKQAGFSVVEIILILIIVILIGTVGWFVYKNYHNTIKTVTRAKSTTTIPTQTTNQYAGWQSFCSNYGGLCIKYPTNWTLKLTTEPISTTQNTQKIDITSPSDSVMVEYQPYCVQLAGPPVGYWTDNILSVTSPMFTYNNFKIIKAISSYQGSNSSNITDSLYLTSSSVVQQDGITVGVHTNTTGITDEAGAGFFTNIRSNDQNLQCLWTSQVNKSVGTNSQNFSSVSKAQAWFSNSEVLTANQILNSVSYYQYQ
ncbi:MAG: hypothetical protein M1554_02360 [Patescibacteria group bacterium]|nr:hypothetical protein [Patescibacteria group bacterium]